MELETDRLTCFAIAQSNTVYSETHQSYLAHYLSRAQYASWQLLIFALYIAVGMVIYILIEHWTAIQALYFCIVSVTTVGYGDVVPKSDAGKLFTVFYVFVGVFIVCSFFYKGLENLLEKHEKRFLQSLVSSDDMNTAIQQQQKAVSSHKNLLWTISITVIVVAVFLVVGALVLILMGEGSFIDGLYFASMTLTTVGYGDYTFDQKYARLFSVFYIITGKTKHS